MAIETETEIIQNVASIDSDYYLKLARDFHRIKKYRDAIDNYKIATKAGNADAALDLATFYYHHKKHARAVKYYKIAIKGGCSAAIARLGTYYFEREHDYKKAAKYYGMAKESGSNMSRSDKINYNSSLREIIWHLDMIHNEKNGY